MDSKYKSLVYDSSVYVSIRDMLETTHNKYPENTAFKYRDNGIIKSVTYENVYENVKEFASYLTSLGLKGKKIAVMGKNSYYWSLTYLTVCSSVGVIVPVDRDLQEEQVNFILDDSETSCIIYSQEEEKKFENRKDNVIYLKATELETYLSEGRKMREEGDRAYENYKPDPFSLGILLYTSGTTGQSKGVMLSQYNICSNVTAVKKIIAIYETDVFLSVLPLHHTYECMSGFLSTFCSGSCVCYNESIRSIMQDLQIFKPTVVIGVPLLFEKIYFMILKKYSNIKGGMTLFGIQKAFASVLDSENARRRIFKSVNDAFGGRLQRILCGAASLKPEVYSGYENFGYKVYVGYGLTETSPVICVHSDSYRSSDDVGMPMPGIEVKIDDPNENGVGELIVRGPNVMIGYYKNEEATNEAIRDGWFHTGDLARIKENGAVKIMGRVKSMIVLQNGKKVFPEELEFMIDGHKEIKESFVFALTEDDKTIITASVYPDVDEIEKSMKQQKDNKLSYEEYEKKVINEIIDKVNSGFPQYKEIKKIIIRKTEFIKTTTSKIKRNLEENMREE